MFNADGIYILGANARFLMKCYEITKAHLELVFHFGNQFYYIYLLVHLYLKISLPQKQRVEVVNIH